MVATFSSESAVTSPKQYHKPSPKDCHMGPLLGSKPQKRDYTQKELQARLVSQPDMVEGLYIRYL